MISAPPRAGAAGDAIVLRLYQRCEWKELALMRHGFTPERLMKLARKIANDGLRLRGATLGDKFEDLASSLHIAGMEAAWRYDPEREQERYGANGGDPFASYVADIMDRRIDDFFRRKAEGFGDRRRGADNMIDLSDDPDPADGTEFEKLVDDRRRARWQAQADIEDQDLDKWIVLVLDAALSVEARAVEIPRVQRRQGRSEIATSWDGVVGL